MTVAAVKGRRHHCQELFPLATKLNEGMSAIGKIDVAIGKNCFHFHHK